MKKATFAALAVMMAVSTAAFAQTADNPVAASSQKADASSGGAFASIPASDRLSSNVIGLDVYNHTKQNIGVIKDLAFDRSGVKAYIVGVGGFLGMGDHYVAVRPSAINLSYNTGDKTWRATIDANADQLRAAPEYKYPANL